ncbi:hypothetical protein PFNF54_03280 [Plasmodium falciparum NF54]|uniref:Uncharacterized protein n=1 Tax=Plasmodium falciparum (isolate NF54) TaxID=5843 RepID=W7K5B2_PLAFO|nr:hypothetical protein PFNF54_03280 [Plasmodium falciparum NF54]
MNNIKEGNVNTLYEKDKEKKKDSNENRKKKQKEKDKKNPNDNKLKKIEYTNKITHFFKAKNNKQNNVTHKNNEVKNLYI